MGRAKFQPTVAYRIYNIIDNSGGSRPSDKMGGWGGQSQKKFFSAHRASVWSKIRGDRAPPLDPPLFLNYLS